MSLRNGFRVTLLVGFLGVVPGAYGLDGTALLAAAAKPDGSAGWSDRISVVVMESFADGDKVRERRAEVKEAMDEEGTVSSLAEYLGPADVLGLRILDLWGTDEEGDAWAWSPATRRSQRIAAGQSDDAPAYGNEPSYRDAQLLELLPRMASDVEVTVVDEERVLGSNVAVLDVDVGDREWPFGRRFRVWIGTDTERVRKVEALGADGDVRRVLNVDAYEVVDGRPVPVRVTIENPLSGRSTKIGRSGVRVDPGLPGRTFSLRDLSKGR